MRPSDPSDIGEAVASAATAGLSVSLPQLLARGEAFSICPFLEPCDVAQLACTTPVVATGHGRDGLWRALFVFRWGTEQGVSHSTEIRVLRSWGDDPWPAPWPLAFGFCGARSSWDHLFWFLPMMRVVLMIDKPTDMPPPALPSSSTWQVVCRVRARPEGAARFARCYLCDVMEVSPPGPAPQHFRQRWARPCSACPRLAHRACLERLLGSVGPPTCADCNAVPTAAISAQLRCADCGEEYHLTSRFPESFLELLYATLMEWRRVSKRIFLILLFCCWLHTLVAHYSMLDSMGAERPTIMLVLAAMLTVSLSQRFHQGVKNIWHTPSRWVFLKLFVSIGALSCLVVLRIFEPSPRQGGREDELSLYSALQQAHRYMYSSCIGAVACSTISWLYVLMASGIIFCFWKTSLRVLTIADVGHAPSSPLKPSSSKCGLCQLGICLDNTAM